jgi:hypothetical protein
MMQGKVALEEHVVLPSLSAVGSAALSQPGVQGIANAATAVESARRLNDEFGVGIRRRDRDAYVAREWSIDCGTRDPTFAGGNRRRELN